MDYDIEFIIVLAIATVFTMMYSMTCTNRHPIRRVVKTSNLKTSITKILVTVVYLISIVYITSTPALIRGDASYLYKELPLLYFILIGIIAPVVRIQYLNHMSKAVNALRKRETNINPVLSYVPRYMRVKGKVMMRDEIAGATLSAIHISYAYGIVIWYILYGDAI